MSQTVGEPRPSPDPGCQTSPTLLREWFVGGILLWLVVILGLDLHKAVPGKLVETDPNLYVAGARSLARGIGYRISDIEGNPPITIYPPITSLVLAPAWLRDSSLDGGIVGARWIMGLVLWISGMNIQRVARRVGLDRGWAWLAAVCAIEDPLTLRLTRDFWSEPLLVLWMTTGAVLLTRDQEDGNGQPEKLFGVGRAIGIGTVLAFAVLTRSAALPIALACIAWSAMPGNHLRGLDRVSIIGLPLGTLIAWRLFCSGQAGYAVALLERINAQGMEPLVSAAASELKRIGSGIYWSASLVSPLGLLGYPRIPGSSIFGPSIPIVQSLIGLGLMGALGWSLYRAGRPGRWVGVGIVGYLAQLVVWPWELGARGTMPLYWIALIGAFLTLARLPNLAGRLPLALVLKGSVAALAAASLALTTRLHVKGREIEAGRVRLLEHFASEVRSRVPDSVPIYVAQQAPLQNLAALLHRRFVSRDSLFLGPVPPPSSGYALLTVGELARDLPRGLTGSPPAISAEGWWYLYPIQGPVDSRTIEPLR